MVKTYNHLEQFLLRVSGLRQNIPTEEFEKSANAMNGIKSGFYVLSSLHGGSYLGSKASHYSANPIVFTNEQDNSEKHAVRLPVKILAPPT